MLPIFPAFALNADRPPRAVPPFLEPPKRELILPKRELLFPTAHDLALVDAAKAVEFGPGNIAAMAGLPGTWPLSFMGRRSAGPVTDPHFASTILLLSGDGTNGSTVFTDESFANRGAATPRGGGNSLVVATATQVFGSGSIRGDSGFNDAISYADHADWTFGTSNFTIEFFHYFESNTAVQEFVSHYNATGNQRGWTCQYNPSGTPDLLSFVASSNGTAVSAIVSGSFTPTIQTWYYICYQRSGNDFYIHTGTPGGTATQLATASNAISIFNSTAAFVVSGNAGVTAEFSGNMDELRITLGVARYGGSSFAVPTAAFPRS